MIVAALIWGTAAPVGQDCRLGQCGHGGHLPDLPLAGLLSPQLYDAMGIYFCLAGAEHHGAGAHRVLRRPPHLVPQRPGWIAVRRGLCPGGPGAFRRAGAAGQGTLWGTQLLPFRLPAVQMVFFGFIAVGMMAARRQWNPAPAGKAAVVGGQPQAPQGQGKLPGGGDPGCLMPLCSF